MHNLDVIITAGRLALARAASGNYHPLRADVLRDVAATYARTVLRREPEHKDAADLLYAAKKAGAAA